MMDQTSQKDSQGPLGLLSPNETNIDSDFQQSNVSLNGWLFVLYHPNANSQQMKATIKELHRAHNLKIFTDWKEASSFIEKSSADCHVITSNINGEVFVKGLFERSNVLSISIFENNIEDWPEWTKNYKRKLICLQDDLHFIIEQIKIHFNDELNIMMSAQQIKEMFLKECLLVLYYPSVHSDIMTSYSSQLQDVCNTKVFQRWEEAIDFIGKTPADCCVVTSEINGETLVEKVYKKNNVFSINIYCNDSQSKPLWTKTYGNKITSVESDFQVIIEKIKKKIADWRKKSSSKRLDFPMFSPIFNEYEKSENNYLNLYLAELTKFGTRDQGKTDFVNLARALYRDSDIDEFSAEYKVYNMQSILKWYTKECFLYKLVNNSLRLAKPDTIYNCRFVLKDLELAIKEQYCHKSKNFNGLLYRAAYLGEDDWTKLQQNQGKEIEMHGFLSTSRIKDTAEGFAQEDRDKKALITIIVPAMQDDKGQGFAEMKEFSLHSYEEEILFNIRSRFTVLETLYEELAGFTYRHLILLYGAQNIRSCICFEKPTIDIGFDYKGSLKCLKCESEDQGPQTLMFMGLKNKQEYICYNCLKSCKSLDNTIFASVRSTASSPVNIKIMGLITNYKEKLNIPFYGYKCQRCQNNKLQTKMTCQTCITVTKEWCDLCFDVNNGCAQAGHVIIVEKEPYTFWSEKMVESDIINDGCNYRVINQGQVFRRTHEFLKAKEYFEKCLSLCDKSNPRTTAFLYLQLGNTLFELSEFDKALEYDLHALEIVKAAYGDKHTLIASCYNNLGSVHHELRQLEKAIQCYLYALEIANAIYGDNHHQTAYFYNSLGLIHHELGQLEKATEYLLHALEIWKSLYGDNDPMTACCYNNLGGVYSQLGQLEKAMEYHSRALKANRTVYGDKHPQTAISYNNLGIVHQGLGQLKKAIECYLYAIKISSAIYGENNPGTATYYKNLGDAQDQLAQPKKAAENILHALEINKAVYGDNHPLTANSYHSLGFLYHRLGQVEKAMEYYLHAFEIRKTVYGDDHPLTAGSYDTLGWVYFEFGQIKKAIKYTLHGLRIRKTVYGNKHPNVATSYNNIGAIYRELGQLEIAMECYLNAFEIIKEIYGENHLETAPVRNNIGLVHHELGHHQQAIEYLASAVEITRTFYGDEHPQTAHCAGNLAPAYRAAGHLEEAIECLSFALRISQKVCGDNHPQTSCFSVELERLAFEKEFMEY